MKTRNQIKKDWQVMAGDLNTLAGMRYAQFVASGKSIPWDEMRNYLEARLAGKIVVRPAARKLTR